MPNYKHKLENSTETVLRKINRFMGMLFALFFFFFNKIMPAICTALTAPVLYDL